MILCQHWEDVGLPNCGRCTAGLYGGRPGTSTCKQCKHKQKGLGDLVAMVAEPIRRKLGVRKCGGCGKRREKLNRLTRKLSK